MLSRLLVVRLKAAENALKDGRYDESFRLATEPDIRAHRRGTAVLTKLTDRFLERAQAHFKADRFAEALLDLTKAEAGGVRTEEIAELREQVQTVAEEELRKENSRKLRVDAARRRIAAGSLRAGERILEQAGPEEHTAQHLRRVVEDQQHDAAEGLDEVERLVGRGQLRDAVSRLERVRTLDPRAARVAELASKITTEVLRAVRASLEAGRVKRAADELGMLGTLGVDAPERRELEDVLRQITRAGQALAENRFDAMRQDLLRLTHVLPAADWVERAAGQVKQLDEMLLSLRAGPLGNLADLAPAEEARPVQPGPRPAKAHVLEETVPIAGQVAAAGGALPNSMLLLIDDGGSFLLQRGERLSIGRAAAQNVADVPIFSDLSERHAEIARVEDDYFLFGSKEVEVAGRRTRHQLLRDGDRVVFGRRAKFTFRQPSRKSGSAILEMSDSTRLPNDVRRVILFRQTATIGDGRAAHIACSGVSRDLLLFERAGQLWIRPASRGGVDTEARPLVIGRPVDVGGISVVIEPWQVRSPGQTRI